MKLFLILILFISLSQPSFAQDSTAYNVQRNKINALLAERSAKFGQYDQSLNERSGIFGFQTKRDIKNSNEILRQITLNDNVIFKELKVLLDYKDLQVQQVKINVNQHTENLLSYRNAIKNLQQQNKKLTENIEDSEKQNNTLYVFIFFAVLVIIILAYLLLKTRYKNEKAVI